MKMLLKVGDEFHKDDIVVRVMSIEESGKYPVRYEWVVTRGGVPGTGHCGINSHRGAFKFFSEEGFTFHSST